MSNDVYNQIREEFITGKIFNIGDIVKDRVTGEQLTVTNRGTNYVIVENEFKQAIRKWLDEIVTTDNKIGLPVLEEGQIKFNNTITEHLDTLTAELLVEKYADTDNLFAWRQAVINLDNAMAIEDLDSRYDLLEKAESYLNKIDCYVPLLEAEKVATEQRKVAQVLVSLLAAAPALIEVQKMKSPSEMISYSIQQLRKSNLTRDQWSVITPIIQVAKDLGIPVSMGQVPFSRDIKESDEELIMDYLEENLDELVEDLEYDDILEAFDDEELCEECDIEFINEVLSFGGRLSLARSMRAREATLQNKRARALGMAASTGKLLGRARKLAVAMLKRRITKKDAGDLTLQDKQRAEAIIAKRKAVIARLATKLLPKVRQLQRDRLSGKGGDR